MDAVSCVGASFCVAVDTSGFATTYNGTSWSTPTDIDGSNALQALSCASVTLCDATDNTGNVLTYNATSWTPPANIDSTRSTTAVSCPATTFCAVADSSGFATVYQPLTTASQLVWNAAKSLPSILSDASNDYVYGPSGEPVEQVALATSTPTYLTYTASNTSWLATNNAGQQLAFWRYDAYGNLALGAPISPFGYAGQYMDPTSGLSAMRARWYAAQTGEFTTRDPAFASTDQAYVYAEDDPINRNDPSGLKTPPWYCLGIFNCSTTDLRFAQEKDLENFLYEAYGGALLGLQKQYRVSRSSDCKRVLRIWDLWDPNFGVGFELKIGYQSLGRQNRKEIGDDVTALVQGIVYNKKDGDQSVGTIDWEFWPSWIEDARLSTPLANALIQAQTTVGPPLFGRRYLAVNIHLLDDGPHHTVGHIPHALM
jgi:RHS repeat-associated protein